MRQLLILSAASVLMLQTAFAQDKPEKTSGNVHDEVRGNLETSISQMEDFDSGAEDKDRDLLNELLQPDSAIKSVQTVNEGPCDSNACTLEKNR